MRVAVVALLLVCCAIGCEGILGIKDPKLEAEADSGAQGDAMTDASSAKCIPAECPFGCDEQTDACRAGKLWVFGSSGLMLGNAFGGADTPPNVRGGADAKCLATYTATYTNRQCSDARVHAILYVSAADSITQMRSKYGIPAMVPVHRASDDMLVADRWDDLVDVAKQPRASATNAPTEAEGIFWSGANGTDTCKNWTAAASTDLGMRGYSTLTDLNWIRRDTLRCDRLSRLLCVCW